MRWFIFGLLFLVYPYSANATVSISEVAWMGSSASVNHEWIELYNDGPPEDMTGWTLTDGANLSISLSGTIQSNTYAVLERTSDDSAPGTAFLIYTGALVNTGATLRLTRADGSLVDQVSGGENWQNIGGDNVTKDTAQYTTMGWVTAPPTPGRGLTDSETSTVLNKTEAESVTTSTRSTTGTVIKKQQGESVRLVIPGVTLQLSVDAQTLGYVNQPIAFSVKPTGIGDTLMASLAYEWNFGDGLVSAQKNPTHIFKYPGTYLVTVYAGYGRQEQVTRHEITILPVTVSLTKNRNGDVQVNNDSPYEVDISKYRLIGEKTFEFPKRSILLPNQTITINKQKIGNTSSFLVGIYDAEGLMLGSIIPDRLANNSFEDEEEEDFIPGPLISSISTSRQTMPANESSFGFSVPERISFESTLSDTDSIKDDEDIFDTNTQLASVVASNKTLPEKWSYLALAGVLLLGTIGVYIRPKSNKKS